MYTKLEEIPISNRFGVEAHWHPDNENLYATESDTTGQIAWMSVLQVVIKLPKPRG